MHDGVDMGASHLNVGNGGDPRYTPDPNRPGGMQVKRQGVDIIRTPTAPCKSYFNVFVTNSVFIL